MVRFTTDPADLVEVETAIGELLAAVHQARPAGTRYAWFKLPGGATFLGLLELEDGVDNPLPGIAAARAFQSDLPHWAVGDPPAPQPLEVAGSYRLFGSAPRS